MAAVIEYVFWPRGPWADVRWRLDYGLLEYGPWDHKVWGLQTVKGSEVVKTEAWLPMPSPLMTRDTLYGWLEITDRR